MHKVGYLGLCLIVIVGCVPRPPVKLPPVVEGWHQPSAQKNAYIVQKKDTLYSIAWAFGLDYRDLAARNNIAPPYTLRYGQRLYIAAAPTAKHQFSSSALLTHARTKIKTLSGWLWPAHGVVVAKFNNKLGGNKGIEIKGDYGSAVIASNAGQVVYSGAGIRSYGNLLIIKHNDDYLSAYAYNKNMLVHEGQEVSAGQKIATMGYNDAGEVRLHFEVRRAGKPVDPLLYLPKST